MHNARKAGYKRRRLELKVANKHRNGEIDTVTYEQLMGSLNAGDTEFVEKALRDDGFKLTASGERKTKPDPVNLTWDEAEDLLFALEDMMVVVEEEYSEERLMNLENVINKTWNAKQ